MSWCLISIDERDLLLSLPINCDFLAYFCTDLGRKNHGERANLCQMTEYKVVQNAGISLTKGANVTLEVFLYIAV